MNINKLFVGLLVTSILVFSGCTGNQTPALQPNPPGNASVRITVVATLFPLYEFAKEVGGDKVDVHLLLPPGAEAHTFDPKPSDLVRINNADMFIFVGAGMEPWAHDIIEGAGEKLTPLDASSKVTLLTTEGHEEGGKEHGEEHGDYDPHIWLDFDNDRKLVDAIAEALIQKDPENGRIYLANAQEYKKKLDALDGKYRQALSNCKHKEFVTCGHNAYAYIAKRYDLTYLAAYGVSPDSEPTPSRIKAITDLTKEHGINYILMEELVSPRLAEAISEESDIKVLAFNPGHNLKKEQFDGGMTFISLMDNNLEGLKRALECE